MRAREGLARRRPCTADAVAEASSAANRPNCQGYSCIAAICSNRKRQAEAVRSVPPIRGSGSDPSFETSRSGSRRPALCPVRGYRSDGHVARMALSAERSGVLLRPPERSEEGRLSAAILSSAAPVVGGRSVQSKPRNRDVRAAGAAREARRCCAPTAPRRRLEW
ncbi:MAG: hypothetical protein RL033_310 [Pseudomonadota bacterium]